MDDKAADRATINLVIKGRNLVNLKRSEAKDRCRQLHPLIRHPAMMRLNGAQHIDNHLTRMLNLSGMLNKFAQRLLIKQVVCGLLFNRCHNALSLYWHVHMNEVNDLTLFREDQKCPNARLAQKGHHRCSESYIEDDTSSIRPQTGVFHLPLPLNLTVEIRQDKIYRPHHCNHICQHGTFADPRKRLHVGKRWGANPATVGTAATLTDQIITTLPFAGLRRAINFAKRRDRAT